MTKNIEDLYNVSPVKGNLRGKAKAGYIRPTITEFFTCNRPYPNIKNTPVGTGGNFTTTYSDGGKTYKVHTFLTGGTLSLTKGGPADILIIAGGGAGGGIYYAGGGGAGGFVYYKEKELNLGDYSITVGTGGQSAGANGQNSTFTGLTTAIGGGGGLPWKSNTNNSGGSGGGVGFGSPINAGGAGTLNQGHGGGNSSTLLDSTGTWGGGGGGAKTAGHSGLTVTPNGGWGGAGYQEGVDTVYNFTDGSQVLFEINGLGSAYAGGGAASTAWGPTTRAYGGSGVGGDGAVASLGIKATDGAANTGSGGGGAGHTDVGGTTIPGKGAAGIVIVRYLTTE